MNEPAQRETPHVGIFWVVQTSNVEAMLLAAGCVRGRRSASTAAAPTKPRARKRRRSGSSSAIAVRPPSRSVNFHRRFRSSLWRWQSHQSANNAIIPPSCYFKPVLSNLRAGATRSPFAKSSKNFRYRINAGNQKMIPRARAGHVEQVALGVIHFLARRGQNRSAG
jgi:hypothetical protein